MLDAEETEQGVFTSIQFSSIPFRSIQIACGHLWNVHNTFMGLRIHTVSVWDIRNGIAGRGNSMCKGGMAMHSVSGGSLLLACGGNDRSGLKSCLEATQAVHTVL